MHGVVPHGEREATDWAVSSSQLARQFLIKHVSASQMHAVLLMHAVLCMLCCACCAVDACCAVHACCATLYMHAVL